MKEYLLITAGDKGEARLWWMNEAGLRKLLADPVESHNVNFFYDERPFEHPEYWREGEALLMRVEILKPQQVQAYVLPEDL